MIRFWFEFNLKFGDKNIPPGTLMGCGITAYNYEDALFLLQEKVFKNRLAPIKNVVENIDVSTLDAGHVLPNMASPNLRGIWFPLGYN